MLREDSPIDLCSDEEDVTENKEENDEEYEDNDAETGDEIEEDDYPENDDQEYEDADAELAENSEFRGSDEGSSEVEITTESAPSPLPIESAPKSVDLKVQSTAAKINAAISSVKTQASQPAKFAPLKILSAAEIAANSACI